MSTIRNLGLAILGAALLTAIHSHAADLVWIGGTGDWNAAGNWSPAQVPTAADNAWLTNSGTYTVTVPAGSPAAAASLTVGGASGTQTLAIDRTTLTLNGASLINPNGVLTFLVSQSVVNGSGNLTVNGLVNWDNGTIGGAGTLTIGSSGALAIGSGGVTLGRTLSNGGNVSWSGGNFTISSGNAINNLAGGTLDITADGRLSGTGTTPINNSGLLRLTAGTTGTTITAPVNNNGILQTLATILNLNLGGSHSGTFSNAPGATVNFGGGSHALSASSLVTGAGSMSLSGGATLAASGTFAAGATLSVNAGVASLSAGCDVTGAMLNVGGAGGVLNFNSAGPVAALNLSGGTLGGTAQITVSGTLTLAGGSITNSLVIANGGLAINGNTTLNGVKLVNPATAVWTAGNITGLNGAAISNLLGATFINTFDGNMPTGSGATPMFLNAGDFQKTNGTAALGATSIDFQFLNTGTVEVRTNTLRYAFNQQTAGLTLLDGGDLAAQAQPLQLLGGSLMGTGLVTVANLQNVVNSSAISPGLPLGELDISGNYQQTASGALNIDLGGYDAGTNFDLVAVTAGGAGGTATVGGTLNVSLANGFSPTNGASFTFLTAASRVGAFATFNYPSNDIGMQLSYGPTSVTAKVTNLKPVVANPIVDPAPITYGSTFNFQFAANTFSDPDGDTFTYTASGLPPGISFTGATRTFSGAPTQAGTFPVTVAATDSGTPSLSVTNSFTVTVNPANLSVTADPQTKTYGASDPALTFTVGGLQFSDTQNSVLTGTLSRAAGENVAGGPYPITQGTLAANGNYAVNFTGNSLAITPALLTVTAQAKTKSYGASDPPLSFVATGLQFSDTPDQVLSGALARAAGETVAGGPYPVLPGTLAANGNYTIAFVGNMVAVTPAILTVTAQAQTKTYGAADSPLTFTVSGLQFSDSQASVLTGALARVSGENVAGSPYAISQGTLTANNNYAISFSASSLTITPASLSVTAQPQTKIYGAADPALAFTVTGLKFADTQNTVLTGTPARAAGETVAGSPYAINQGTLAANSNYTISFTGDVLTITPATLTIAAQAQTKIYGAADPALSFTVSGLQFSDTQATVLSGALTRTVGESVNGSPYAIAQGTLAANANYSISFTGNSLTITLAPLLVSPLDANRAYGQTNPVFTVSYTGFVNGETNTVLEGMLLLSTTADTNSPVGSYPVIASGLLATNYSITYTNGTLTVLPQALTVTADDKHKPYGTADPGYTASYSGFVNGETSSALTGLLSFSRTAGENVNTYPITPSGLSSTNYAITFINGTLTIDKAVLTVSADSQSKSYGSGDPALTFKVSGLQFTDTQASVLTGALTRGAGETVAGGPYAITQGTLGANANYSISFIPNTLTVTPANLTITAQPQAKIYGAADPSFTFTVSGLQFADTQASVLSGAVTRTAGENVAGGPYAINQGTLVANSNYSISFTGSALTITPAPLAIGAQAQTKTYGAPDPLLAFTVSGLQFADTQSLVLTGALARTPGETVAGGPYSITQGTLVANANYTISFTGNSLAITPAPLSITADSKTKIFGAADPAFTVAYAGFVPGDSAAGLAGTLSLTRAPGEGLGSYPITPSGLSSPNYTITFNPGTLTIIAPAPVILALTRAGAAGINITWSAVSNATYRVQYKEDLNGANWTDLAGDVTANAASASKADTLITGNRFYRIHLLP